MSLKILMAAGVLACAAMCSPMTAKAAAPATAKGDCSPSGGLKYVCGVNRGEDLVLIPGTHWIITSGLGEGGALHLLDADHKTARRWYPDAAEAPKPDPKTYPGCASPPDAKRFFAHGLSIRNRPGGKFTLYMVGHNVREAVEVFEVTGGAKPAISWVGCVPMPKDWPLNSVAATPDGSLLGTVLNLPNTTRADIHAGRPTGAVVEWDIKTKTWRKLPNTNLAGNNGIETSPDGKTFYVVALGSERVLAYDRADPNKKPRVAQLKGFWPDNVRFDLKGRLITAGGSTPCIDAKGVVQPDNPASCPSNYVVAAIDPKTMTSTVLAKGPTTPTFSGPTIGLPLGKDLWIGTHESGRIAYVPTR